MEDRTEKITGTPVWVCIVQSMEGLKRSEWQNKGMFSLFELRYPSSPSLDIGAPGSQGFGLELGLKPNLWSFFGSQTFGLELGLTPLAPLVFKPSGVVWNYTTGFPGPPVYRWQAMGPLSLHNHMSQPLLISPHFLFYWFFYLGGP